MEYSLKQENCTICENLLRSSSEQPVDLELTLPDHCPDIERILKCRMEHSITSEIITGSRLDIDGMISVRLYYLDSKKQAIRYFRVACFISFSTKGAKKRTNCVGSRFSLRSVK